MTPCGLTIEKRLPSLADTQQMARVVAGALRPGDVILLSGPLGAGKSAFARSIIMSLIQSDEPTPSPTFTLVQTYEAPRFDIWHFDLYRLSDPSEAQELGLDEALKASVLLVEWPERLEGRWPDDRLHITLTPDPNATSDAVEDEPRTIRLCAQGSWVRRLKELSHEF